MLKGSIALVTGASRGIGQEIAREMARQGAVVAGTATTAAGAEKITAQFQQDGTNGAGWVLDVNDPAAITAVVDDVRERFGAITVLVNNAGIARDNLLVRLKDEDWDAVLDTSLKAAFRMARAVTRDMMKARGGRIINIGSVIASTGNVGQVSYAAAKAGLGGLTRALARELGSRNITVNTVAPGYIDTDMTRELSEEQRAQLINAIPMSRLGSTEDVAAAVCFLASPGARYITGSTLHVNGGAFMN